MRISPVNFALGLALTLSPAAAWAQPADAGLAVPNPRYATLILQVDVAKPADQTWARVGKFCDIAEWLYRTCALTSGVDGQVGAIRTLDGGGRELLVARTDLSYTWVQPVRKDVPYNAYHATLEAKPVTAKSSKLLLTFFYDTSMLGDDAAVAAERARRTTRFNMALRNMKLLAEGKAIPPAPAPASPATPSPAAPASPAAPR